MKFKGDVIRIVVYIISFLMVIYFIQPVFMAKFIEADAYSPRATYEGFYEQPVHSLDVLFLGTSQCYNSFSPEVLYREYGISSYNLGSSMQSTVLSYFWLKEALKYQDPAVVVFQVYNMIPFGYSEPEDIMWNSREAQIRQGVDYMRWSRVKMECVDELCRRDATLSLDSFVFPIIRYHDRWEELTEEDYNSEYFDRLKVHRGYKPVTEKAGEIEYEPIKMGKTAVFGETDSLHTEYVDAIVELCRENGIKLIFVRTPYVGASEQEYLQIKEYASINKIDYYDLNLEDLYKEMNYDICNDNVDSGHANINGAAKITSFIGDIIKTEFAEGQRR